MLRVGTVDRIALVSKVELKMVKFTGINNIGVITLFITKQDYMGQKKTMKTIFLYNYFFVCMCGGASANFGKASKNVLHWLDQASWKKYKNWYEAII